MQDRSQDSFQNPRNVLSSSHLTSKRGNWYGERTQNEFHTIKCTLADPQFGLAHLNDEFHTTKEMLTELSQQVESLRR